MGGKKARCENEEGAKYLSNQEKWHFKVVFLKIKANAKKIQDEQNVKILNKHKIQSCNCVT